MFNVVVLYPTDDKTLCGYRFLGRDVVFVEWCMSRIVNALVVVSFSPVVYDPAVDFPDYVVEWVS